MKRSLSVLLLLFSVNSWAYEGTPQEQVIQFFQDLAKGQASDAIDKLYASNPLIAQKSQQLMVLKQELNKVAVLYGDLLGTENVHYEQLSPSLVRIVELAKHEGHPVTWQFYFYKPHDVWMIDQGHFEDQYQLIDRKGCSVRHAPN